MVKCSDLDSGIQCEAEGDLNVPLCLCTRSIKKIFLQMEIESTSNLLHYTQSTYVY